jgi:hypothetical protein
MVPWSRQGGRAQDSCYVWRGHQETVPVIAKLRQALEAVDLKVYDAVKISDGIAALMRASYEIGREDEAKGITRRKGVRKPLQRKLLPSRT